ncbi:MAG: hypothetical protein NTZ26_15205 [Candidatus Aminicenantes bacterium]|nr:hypothetical protein [Candidatus Aminicenantes bacterium]
MRKISIGLIAVSVAALLASPVVSAVPVQFGAQAAATPAADEVTYRMPAGWVAQALRGGPDLKAHYVYMSGGRPYGEMFLTQNPAPAGQTLAAAGRTARCFLPKIRLRRARRSTRCSRTPSAVPGPRCPITRPDRPRR